MGIERLELSQHYCHMLLKHTCIPISPYPQKVRQFFKLDAQKTRSFKKEKVKKAYLKQYKTKLKKSLRYIKYTLSIVKSQASSYKSFLNSSTIFTGVGSCLLAKAK